MESLELLGFLRDTRDRILSIPRKFQGHSQIFSLVWMSLTKFVQCQCRMRDDHGASDVSFATGSSRNSIPSCHTSKRLLTSLRFGNRRGAHMLFAAFGRSR